MERSKLVRSLRFSEIDTISDIPFKIKDRIRRKIANDRRKPENKADLINIEKIKANDNKEWSFLMELYGERFKRFCGSITLTDRFIDDIVANAIADAISTREIFTSGDHLVGHIFSFIRYESFNWMKKGPGRFILDEDVVHKIDWYFTITNKHDQPLTPLERADVDKWKDDMLEFIKKQSQRLPRNWRSVITAYLTYNSMKEVKKSIKENGSNSTTTETAIKCLKDVVQFRRASRDRDRAIQMEEMRHEIRKSPTATKRIIKMLVQGIGRTEIAETFNLTYPDLSERVNKLRKRLVKIYPDPMMTNYRNSFLFFRHIADEDILQLLKEETSEDSPYTKVYRGYAPKQFTKEEITDIILLRNQHKLSFEKIARRLHTDEKKIKKVYFENVPKGEEIIMKIHQADVDTSRKLKLEQVVEIRRLYNTGEYTQQNLASQFGVKRTTIQSITDGRNWKTAI